MLPLTDWPLAARRRITGVLTDIDDTLTTNGVIAPEALAALGALQAAGLAVIAVTGRPVGWSAPFAKAWPVDAIVAENGAVALLRNKKAGFRTSGMDSLLSKLYQQSPGVRAANFSRMQQVAARIERELPGVRRADDSAGRETDMAIDHSEFAQLDGTQTAAVVALMHSEGMQATVSSIHINGWYGQHNKLTGALWRGDPFVRLTVDCHDSPTTTLDKIQLREDFAAGRRGCEFFKALLQRIAATRSAQTIPMAY